MAGRKIIWSPTAKIDLFEILNYYYKKTGNKKYSRQLNKKIKKAIGILTKYANIGVQTDVVNVRNLIVDNYSIFYRIEKNTIEIITIWDSRQNPEKLDIKKL